MDSFSELVGIGMFAVNGEAAGAAVIDGNHVAISYVHDEPSTGDAPVLDRVVAYPPGRHRRQPHPGRVRITIALVMSTARWSAREWIRALSR